MNLRSDCTLAYIVGHEAWYYNGAREREDRSRTGRYFTIQAAAEDGGCEWEFMVYEYDLNELTLHVEMFADSFQAFEQIPEFFAALNPNIHTLDDLRALLDGLGASDKTARRSPYPKADPREELAAAVAEAQAKLDAYDRDHVAAPA